jgi:hypothetical protein
VLGEKTLDKMRKMKTMRSRKIVMKELGFLPSPTCFIYKYTLMGLCREKDQVHLRAFIFSPEQKSVSKTRIREKDEKVYIRSTTHLVMDSGAHIMRREVMNN